MTRAPHLAMHAGARAAGFSLIEMLVSMVIGLVLTLAITSVLIRNEGGKRSTTSVNDLNQSGAYAAYTIDRSVRSAGSGFVQNWSAVFGCLLDVTQSGTRVLPLPSAIPATSAFVNVTLPFRLAPLVIGKGLADSGGAVRGDVLIVMQGTAGYGESQRPVTPTGVTSTNLVMRNNTLGFRTADMVLLSDPGVPGGCMMQQVTFPGTTAGSTDLNLPLAGTYYAANGTNVNLANFGANTIALQLGNAAANPPQFVMYGVGANNTLTSYDLLQPGGNESPVADGVVEMRALYGVSNSFPAGNVVDSWVDPAAGSGWEASVLTNGSATSQALLRRILAVRIGMFMRTSLQEKGPVLGPTNAVTGLGTLPLTLTLFSDLGPALQQTRTYAAGTPDLNYRYRTVEVTVPLRNIVLAP